MPERREIHTTWLNTFYSCQAKFMFIYELGLRRPGSGHLHRGSCYHNAMHFNFKQKEVTFADMPVGDVVDAYDTSWAKSLDDREIDWGDLDIGKFKDAGERMVRKYMESLAKEAQPFVDGVEASHVVPIAGTNFELHFRIDFAGTVFKVAKVVDHKTASSKWSAGKELSELQGYMYPLGWQAITGDLLPMEFHVNVARKKDGEIQIVPSALTKNRYLWFRNWLLPGMLDAIERGVYLPTGRGWECTRKWCGFWGVCKGGANTSYFPMGGRLIGVQSQVPPHHTESGAGIGLPDVEPTDGICEGEGPVEEGVQGG